MNKKVYSICIALFITVGLMAQDASSDEFKPSGSAFGKVFWNYHYDFTEGITQKNAFEVQRAYMGYKYKFSENISTKITFDGAKYSEASQFTVFLKIAQLDWELNQTVSLSMGLIGLQQFNTQEKFFNYRYLFKTFQDNFGLGTSADLGVNAKFSLMPNLEANLFVLNGEGYTRLQDDYGRMKMGGSIVFEPIDGLVLKGYADVYGGYAENSLEEIRDTVSIKTFDIFAGYKTSKFRIGAGYGLQLDGTKYNEQVEGHDMKGSYINGAYTINDKFELFGMWFNFKSNKLEGATETWNYDKDGNVVLGGIQYKAVKGVRFALNYRTFLYDNPALKTGSFVYVNCEFAF